MGEVLKKPYEISIWEDELITPEIEGEESYYKERKVAIIGSDKMVAPGRVISPVLKENVNGEKTLTFSIEFRYFDEQANDIITNPIYPLLVNERKVKLFYNDHWYDFIIKEVEEDKEQNTFNYTAKDVFVNELAKQGYNIEFDQELDNNLGTITELAKEALKNTDWQVDEEDTDLLRQLVNEPLYECVISESFSALNLDTMETEQIEINETIYIFYSYVSSGDGEFLQFIRRSDGDNWKIDDDNIIVATNYRYQGTFTSDENNRVIILHGDESDVTINVGDPFLGGEAYRLVYQKRTFYDPVMEKYVELYKINYEDDEQEVYKYTETNYGTSTVVLSTFTSGSDFKADGKSGIVGWDGANLFSSNELPTIGVASFPSIGKNIVPMSVNELNSLTAYLQLYFPELGTKDSNGRYLNSVFNSGIMDHGAQIDHISKEEEYSFRIRAGYGIEGSSDNPTPLTPDDKILPIVAFYNVEKRIVNGISQDVRCFTDEDIIFKFDGTYEEAPKVITGGTFEEDDQGNKINYIVDRVAQAPSLRYYYQVEDDPVSYIWKPEDGKFIPVDESFLKYYLTSATALKTVNTKTLTDPSERIGIFLMAEDSSISGTIDVEGETKKKYLYIDEVELFKTYYDSEGEEVLPGNLPTSEAKDVSYYYLKPDNGISKEEINLYSSLEGLASDLHINPEDITIVYNKDSEKILSIEESHSNCFNILQTLCETFECWLKLTVEHEENGAIKLDENHRPIKKVSFKEFVGKENFAGFKYGINLTSITRLIDSNEIVTKLIILDSESDYTDNGILSISYADANPSKESVIYNLDYYVQKGLIKNEQQYRTDLNTLYNDISVLNGEIQRLSDEFTVANTALMTVESYNNDYVEVREVAQKGYNDALAKFEVLAGTSYENYIAEHEDPTINPIDEGLFDVIYEIYSYANVLNTNGGAITTTGQEYTNLKNLVGGALEYSITVSTSNSYNQDESVVPAKTKLIIDDYLEGFDFQFERGSLTKEYKSGVNRKEFEAESDIPYNVLRIESLPEGYILEYTYNGTKRTGEVGSVFSIYNDKDEEGKIRRFKLVPSEELQEEYPGYQKQIDKKIEEKAAIIEAFESKYSQFIQEGTWESTSYIDSNLYYFDAVQVSLTSSKPQISYTINVVEVSEIEGLENYYFEIGDKTYIEDTEFFGWTKDIVPVDDESVEIYTPVKEEVILSEIEWYLDDPSQNTITVQNYKTQFEDLFQRISATVQSVEYQTSSFSRAAALLTPEGTISTDTLIKSLNGITSLGSIALAVDGAIEFTKDGIIAKDLTSQSRYTRLIGRGLQISNDGGKTWSDVITADGITTSLLTAGSIDTQNITIMDGDNTSFRWDKNGLSAYGFNEKEGYDLNSFVRMDKYGLYGIKNGEDYIVSSLDDLLEKAHFSLTWDGFRIKSDHGNGYVSITSDNDFEVVRKVVSGRSRAVNETEITKIHIGTIEKDGNGTPTKYGIVINNDAGEPVLTTDDNGDIVIAGTVYANAGEIGGFEVDNELSSGRFGESGSILLSPGHYGTLPVGRLNISNTWVISAGSDFGVTSEGSLYANDAYINGVINATSGNFTGQVNAESGTFKGNIIVGNNNDKYITINAEGDEPIIASSDYIHNTSMGWMINGSGDALFNNVSVRGAIRTAVFEYSEIEAVGGAFLFRPSSSIKTVTAATNPDNLIITVDKPLQFKQYEWVKLSNANNGSAGDGGLTYVYKVLNDPAADGFLELKDAGKDFESISIDDQIDDDFYPVTPPEGTNPHEKGYYEKTDNGDYVLTEDTTVISTKTYYLDSSTTFEIDDREHIYVHIFDEIKLETIGAQYHINFDEQKYNKVVENVEFVTTEFINGNTIPRTVSFNYIGNLSIFDGEQPNTGETFLLTFEKAKSNTSGVYLESSLSSGDSLQEYIPVEIVPEYNEVDDPTGSPVENGYYEYDNDVHGYILSGDTQVDRSKTYYVLANINPSENYWYEFVGGVYQLTLDTEVIEGKIYYTRHSRYYTATYAVVDPPVGCIPVNEKYYEEYEVDGTTYYVLTNDDEIISGKNYFRPNTFTLVTNEETVPEDSLITYYYLYETGGTKLWVLNESEHKFLIKQIYIGDNSTEDLVGGALISFGYAENTYTPFNVPEDGDPAGLGLYEATGVKIKFKDVLDNPDFELVAQPFLTKDGESCMRIMYNESLGLRYLVVSPTPHFVTVYSENEWIDEKYQEITFVNNWNLIPSTSKESIISNAETIEVITYILTQDESPVEGKVYYKERYEDGRNNYGIGINSSDNYVGLPERAISLFESDIHPNEDVKVTYDYKGILGTLSNPGDDYVNKLYKDNMIDTQGIFTNNMYIGDATQYLAFFTDKSDGKRHLKINAAELTFGDDGKITLEDLIAEGGAIQVSVESNFGANLTEDITYGIIYARVVSGDKVLDDFIGIGTLSDLPVSAKIGDNFAVIENKKVIVYRYIGDGGWTTNFVPDCEYNWTFINGIPGGVPDLEEQENNQFIYVDSSMVNNNLVANVEVTYGDNQSPYGPYESN